MKTYSVSVSAYIRVKANSKEEALEKTKKKLGKIRSVFVDQITPLETENEISAVIDVEND